MSDIITELQADLIDSNKKLSDILSKAYLVSNKLGIKELEDWLSNEINGYKNGEDVPEYRIIKGVLKGFSGHNWLLVNINQKELQKKLYQHTLESSVSQIEFFLCDDNNFQVCYPPNTMKLLGLSDCYQISLFVDKSELLKILTLIKQTLLDWTLKLEKEGITGDGLTFSKEEKEKAQNLEIPKSITNVTHINNFNAPTNIQNQPQNSVQIQNNNLDLSTVKEFLEALEAQKSLLKLEQEKSEKLKNLIAEIRKELSNPKPKEGIIKQSLTSIKKIVEGATGNLVASGILQMLSFLN